MWQATGDSTYLDNIIIIVENIVADARPVGGGHLGWTSNYGLQHALWNSFYGAM